jgi:hypothetical protein
LPKKKKGEGSIKKIHPPLDPDYSNAKTDSDRGLKIKAKH